MELKIFQLPSKNCEVSAKTFGASNSACGIKQETKMKKAIILLSGGLDSTTCMAVAKEQGYELYPISFDYHQRHNIE